MGVAPTVAMGDGNVKPGVGMPWATCAKAAVGEVLADDDVEESVRDSSPSSFQIELPPERPSELNEDALPLRETGPDRP